MKNHLKRISAPRTWKLNRKEHKFTLRPNCGAHSLDNGLALGSILRDHLKLVSTMSEAEKLLNNNDFLVDGKRKKDRKTIVGLFDRLAIPKLSLTYELSLDTKGRLIVLEISQEESNLKILKVTGKTVLPKNKIQLNLYDGKNIFYDQPVKVGDSVLVSLPDLKVKEVLPLKEGASVFLVKGKHAGSKGVLKSINDESAHYVDNEKNEVETSKRYLFVLNKN